MSVNGSYPACLLVLGESGVGKTTMVHKFTKPDLFEATIKRDEYDPTIEDEYVKTMVVDSISISVRVLDLAGFSQWKSLDIDSRIKQLVKEVDVVVLCFDLTQPDTMKAAGEHYERLVALRGFKIPCVVVGTKADLPKREISLAEAKQFAQDKGPYYEISPFDPRDDKVPHVFTEAMWRMYNDDAYAFKMNSRASKDKIRHSQAPVSRVGTDLALRSKQPKKNDCCVVL